MCCRATASLDNYNLVKHRLQDLPEEELKPKPLVGGDDLIAAGYRARPEVRRDAGGRRGCATGGAHPHARGSAGVGTESIRHTLGLFISPPRNILQPAGGGGNRSRQLGSTIYLSCATWAQSAGTHAAIQTSFMLRPPHSILRPAGVAGRY